MDKPIRILHVFGIMNIAGAENLIMNIYREIDKNKFQFDFIVHTEKKGYFDEEIKKLGGKIYHFPKYKVFNHLLYMKTWKDFLSENTEYKIIHGHMRGTANYYLEIAKSSGLITIMHSHNVSNGSGISALIKDRNLKKIKCFTDYKLACSPEAGNWMFGSDSFEVLKNGINLNKFKFDKQKRNETRDYLNIKNEVVIGHVGRFVDQKNQSFLIDVFYKFQLKHKNSKLILIGEGENKKILLNKVSKLGITHKVKFLTPQVDIGKFMMAFDLFLFPSIFEGLGIVLIEAQTTGLKCLIADNITDEVKLSDDITKISLEAPKSQWVNQMELLLCQKTSRLNSWKKTSEKKYTIKQSSEKLQNIYLRLLNKYFFIKGA